MSNLTCSFEFSGMSDYWGGMGDRGRGHGAAFAYYGRDTTLRDIVDQWVEETWCNEHDFDDMPESISRDDVRDCIVESLTAQGRADYDSGALCEWSAYCEDERECRSCGERIGEPHCEDCDNAVSAIVEDDDCDDDEDNCESPIAIMEIDWTDHPDYSKYEDNDGKLIIGERVMIDGVGDGYGYGEIVKITGSSAFININGEKYRRNFEDVYPCNE